MTVEFAEEHRMVLDLVEKFVENELMPFEKVVMEREQAARRRVCCRRKRRCYLKMQGAWTFRLDAPEEMGAPICRRQ